MPHDAIENAARMRRTAFEIVLEFARISRRAVPVFAGAAFSGPCSSRAMARVPAVRKRASATSSSCAAGTALGRRGSSGDCPGAGEPKVVRNCSTTQNSCQTYVTIELLALFTPMLRFLSIKRLAVIDAAEVEFKPGLNVLTGETGAGKSILVEAVGLLLGGRASGDLVRTGEEVATIEAIFERGGEELLVRREVTAQGRSRAFINGDLATAGALKDLSGRLIELHGQHEHQTLLDPSTHLGVLDAFGGLEPLAGPVRASFDAMRAAADAVSRLRAAAGDRESRLDLIAFQLGELDRANLKACSAGEIGEDLELTAVRQVLANAERVER